MALTTLFVACQRPPPAPTVRDAGIVQAPPQPRIQRAPRPEVALPAKKPTLELLDKVGGHPVPLEAGCAEVDRGVCVRGALDRAFLGLDRVYDGRAEGQRARILVLGDSHIAADYVTRTLRTELQRIFGDGGRGYIHADQKDGYGGRRLPHFGWTRHRMVDPGEEGGAFGFSGFRLEASHAKATSDFKLEGDARVQIFLQGGPDRGVLKVSTDGKPLGELVSTASAAQPLAFPLDVPKGAQLLHLLAPEPNVSLLGISFESKGPGLCVDAVGPVGSDATSYAGADEASFVGHVALLDPSLVIIMLGGNDALRIRAGKAGSDDVRQSFLTMLERLRRGAPEADCMLIGPMDAGDTIGGKIVSKPLIAETRALLREFAEERGCAFWDLYSLMGGQGSIARWSKAGIMNADLIHPRAKAGDLIGEMLAVAVVEAYAQGSNP